MLLLLIRQICAAFPSADGVTGGGGLIKETGPLVLGTTVAQRIISADADANRADSAEWFRRVVIDDGRRRNEGGELRLALALHQLLLVAGNRTEEANRRGELLSLIHI